MSDVAKQSGPSLLSVGGATRRFLENLDNCQNRCGNYMDESDTFGNSNWNNYQNGKMEVVLRRPFLMVACDQSHDSPFKNHKLISVVSVVVSNPYERGEKYGRCRWKKVYGITDKGMRFLLSDDTEKIRNFRQYGSGFDPISWGKDLPGYTEK